MDKSCNKDSASSAKTETSDEDDGNLGRNEENVPKWIRLSDACGIAHANRILRCLRPMSYRQKHRCDHRSEHRIKVSSSHDSTQMGETTRSDNLIAPPEMQPGVSNPSVNSTEASHGSGIHTPRNVSSIDVQENQQSLQGEVTHEQRRRTRSRRGRRRGRRRRRGQQRARARARAREEAQNAMAEIAEDSGSTSDDEDESQPFEEGSASARSRSPRRQRSLDNSEFLRRGVLGIRPTATPPRLQPSPCRVPNCEWTGPLENAAQHARTAHSDAILEGARQRLSVPLAFAAYTRYWRLIDAFDELFLVQFRRRAGARRRLQAAVQLVGPASRAARFLYLLHMQAVESADGSNPQSSTQPTENPGIPPSSQQTTRISLVVGQTSSTRVDLEPAMISLWSAHNFSQLEASTRNDSTSTPVLQTIATDSIANTSALRVLDLTVTIQRVLGQKD